MSTSVSRAHRGTIHSVTAEVLQQEAWPDGQYVLRLQAPAVAALSPGGPVRPRAVRSPTSPCAGPCRCSGPAPEGWIEVLYKVHGEGLAALAEARPGDRLSVLGPIGNGFRTDPDRPQAVLVGGGVGIPPLVFLAEQLRAAGAAASAVGFFGSELPFPYAVRDPALALPGAPEGATASLALVDDWNIPRGWPVARAFRAVTAATSPSSPAAGSPASRRRNSKS
jgi:dihydroorotate dehydrogenase electron transfer subunit